MRADDRNGAAAGEDAALVVLDQTDGWGVLLVGNGLDIVVGGVGVQRHQHLSEGAAEGAGAGELEDFRVVLAAGQMLVHVLEHLHDDGVLRGRGDERIVDDVSGVLGAHELIFARQKVIEAGDHPFIGIDVDAALNVQPHVAEEIGLVRPGNE